MTGLRMMHASCVALAGPTQALRGVLLCGASGCGKSSLALELMSRGGRLVSDDQVEVFRRDGALWGKAPKAIAGLIEARGIGLLRADFVAEVQLHVIVDMNRLETDRLPGQLIEHILGVDLPKLNRVDSPWFPAALIQYVQGGVLNPDDGLASPSI